MESKRNCEFTPALVIREAEAFQDAANFGLSVQVAEDAVEKGESEEKREESGGKVKKIPKFNWAEDVDVSIGLIDIVCNTPTAVANGNTSGNAFPLHAVQPPLPH